MTKASTMPSHPALTAARQQPSPQREKGPAKSPPCRGETNNSSHDGALMSTHPEKLLSSLPPSLRTPGRPPGRAGCCRYPGLMLPRIPPTPERLSCALPRGPCAASAGTAGDSLRSSLKILLLKSSALFGEECSLHIFRITKEKDRCLRTVTL